MIIGVDVDNCVVDVIPHWVVWLNEVTGKNYSLEDSGYKYDFFTMYEKELEELGMDGKEWWRFEHIYDNASPIKDSVNALQYLYARGHQIVFISKVIGNHGESKKAFLNNYFPFNSGIIFTDEKGFVNVDVMIDDRNMFLNQFDKSVTKILFETPYTQCEDMSDDVLCAKDWTEVANIILVEDVFNDQKAS